MTNEKLTLESIALASEKLILTGLKCLGESIIAYVDCLRGRTEDVSYEDSQKGISYLERK